jgi:hypothetical protein
MSYKRLCTVIPEAVQSRWTAVRLVSGRWPRPLGVSNCVVRLIDKPFGGNKRYLREVSDVTTAFDFTCRDQHGILLKCVKTKITGEARSELLVRELTET